MNESQLSDADRSAIGVWRSKLRDHTLSEEQHAHARSMIAEISGKGLAGRIKTLEDRVAALESGKKPPAAAAPKAKPAKKPVKTPSAPKVDPPATPPPAAEKPVKVAPDKPKARGRGNENRSVKAPGDGNQAMPDWLTGNPADVPGEDE